jgi:hypothetical protein
MTGILIAAVRILIVINPIAIDTIIHIFFLPPHTVCLLHAVANFDSITAGDVVLLWAVLHHSLPCV